MFGRKPNHEIYKKLSIYTFDHARAFLSSQKDKRPSVTNMGVTMIAALATGNKVAAILGSMPSLKNVNADILTLDALAWSCTTWQRALHTRYMENRYEEGAERAWLSSSSVARTIKDYQLDKLAPEIGGYWLDRWIEFRALNTKPRESFGLLTYLLLTSKGHRKPMKRYPGSPPMLLDFEIAVESLPAQIACGHAILACVDNFINLAVYMPEEEDDEEIYEDDY